MRSEEWKPVKGFEDKYMVSSYGNVKSLNFNRTGKARFLTPHSDYNGYVYFVLCVNGKHYHKFAHRLVAEAFLDNPDNYSDVCHIDDDTTNNHVDNLMWASHWTNCNIGEHGNRVSRSLRKIRMASGRKVWQCDMVTGEKIACFYSTSDATRAFGAKNNSAITFCASGKKKSAYGFKWVYDEKILT